MTDTVVSSATREVVIGFDRPFVIIGERINPTGRKILAAEMAAGDFSRVSADALAQVEAGAHMLDVNAGIPLADEPAILARAVELVQSITDVPLSIDSSIVAALEAGLKVYKGKPLVNSVTGEEERLEAVLPLVRKYGAAVVAISNDETGISEDPDVRFAVAKKIVERAADHGIPACDIVIDPLVMPIGAIRLAGVQVMDLVRRLRSELKVNTTCGASNVSFGLPQRDGINTAFLTMAIASGLTSAITNPLHADIVKACMAADVMMGHDPDCTQWIRKFRETPPVGADGEAGRAAGAKSVEDEAAERRTRAAASATDALVVFTPSGRRGRVPIGTPLLQAARSLGVDIDSVCGGRGLCGRCQVLLAEGDFAKHGVTSRAENLSPFGAVEREYCRHQPMAPGRRLSCSAQVLGDLVIDVPSDSQVHRQVVRKAAEAHDIELDPVVRLHYVEVQQPDMHDPSGDLRRLEDALDFEWRLTGLACDVRVLQQLQPALRKGGWKVTVAVHGGSQIIAVWPGFRERVYGIAIDVGSTTIAAHLCDLSSGEVVAAAGAMNPQIRFGEDLMSRVSWVMMNPGGEQ